MAFSVALVAAASEVEAVRIGYDAMAIGADAIMCQWSPRFVAAAAEAGIPVQGHAGLVPRKSTWTGGAPRRSARTSTRRCGSSARSRPSRTAGAYAVEVEVIPAELLVEISRRTRLLTSSIGAGSGGDIQFLFAEDILGNNPPPYPRHSKQYRLLYKLKDQMQAERVAGFKEFVADVRDGRFPRARAHRQRSGEPRRRLPRSRRDPRLIPTREESRRNSASAWSAHEVDSCLDRSLLFPADLQSDLTVVSIPGLVNPRKLAAHPPTSGELQFELLDKVETSPVVSNSTNSNG